MGAYTYGNATHVHAVTAIDPSRAPTYTARYDAAGDMTCRAPDATTTCTGTPTGAQLTFDPEGRLVGWSGGTTTDSFLYDGAGNRVEQQVILNGSSTTLTKYIPSVSGMPIAERSGTAGPLTYLASDGQGSVSAALKISGRWQRYGAQIVWGSEPDHLEGCHGRRLRRDAPQALRLWRRYLTSA